MKGNSTSQKADKSDGTNAKTEYRSPLLLPGQSGSQAMKKASEKKPEDVKHGIPNLAHMTYAEIKAYREKQRELGEDHGNEDEEKSCFTEFVKILKTIFFVDTGKILKNSNASKREMETYDIQRLPPQYKNEHVSRQFKELFAEWEKLPKKPPMWTIYLKMEKKRIIQSTILRVIADVLMILIPLMMIQYESGFIYDNQGTDLLKQEATMKPGTTLAWACIVLISFVVLYMCRQHSDRLITLAKFRIEQALKDQLFMKLLNADYISIAESDPNQVSKILFFGIDNMMATFLIIPAVISSPIAIIIGCFLIARAHSNYFFLVAVIVYLLICFAGIDYFNGISAKYQAKYDTAQSLNSIKVEEFFDNITTIQTNSLGVCLKDRFFKIRQMANDTLKYLHLATGIAEVILSLSPFIFTALAVTLYHFASIGNGSENDSIRLMVCAMAPMTIPIKVITDSLYKRRLFKSSFGLVVEFLDSLRGRASGDDGKVVKPIGKSKSGSTIVKMTTCSFLRDQNKKETFETVMNPKKDDIKDGKQRYIIFKNPDNLNSLTYQIDTASESIKKQETTTQRYTTGAGSGAGSNVNYCLKGITLAIKAKMKVCIVGDENSGVNDFFLAIMRELIKAEGTMTLRGKACYLDMNNPKFIRDTIKENILLGRPVNKELYNALINTVIDLRLSKYPLKDRTVIVEGQKNIAENDVAKILLARLLYSDADLVLMNSYFDVLPKNRQIQTYDSIVEDFLREKTVIFSTRVVHLIKKADIVLVMKDGMKVEEDTYEKLMEKRDSQLYKYLMTDPAGNTNLFSKVLDLFRIKFKKPDENNLEKVEDSAPGSPDQSPQRSKSNIGYSSQMLQSNLKTLGAGLAIATSKYEKRNAVSGVAAIQPGNMSSLAVPLSSPEVVAIPENVPNKAEERQRNQKTRKRNASQGTDDSNVKDLGKLQRNIMYNGSLSTKVVFVGQSSLAFYGFILSLLITNIAMVGNLLETCIWGKKVIFLESYTNYLLAYDGLVLFYIAIVIIRDGLFSKLVIYNLNHLYNLMTNSLIDTQKEYLLQNPSTRIVYLMTKTIAKIDRDLIRSYYHYFDSIFILLVVIGALNYFLYIFMSIITICWMIILIPTYSTFNTGCVKLSTFTTNYSSDLVEVFLSSFNFILPLRNHGISGYFSKKFIDCSDTVMRAKIRLEDDIIRWFHLRYMIYSSLLLLFILFIPIIVIQFLASSYLTHFWEFKFVAASVSILLPVLINFANSLTETSINMICVKSIIKYVLELSKNSEDANIIKQLAAMPAMKSKYIDEEEIQEANLLRFILKREIKNKPTEGRSSQKRIMPARLTAGMRSEIGTSELYRSNTQVPGESKKSRHRPNEPSKPLLMLKNVIYESKIGEKIVDGINLKLYEAERIGVICEMASGKDFLINLLMTLIQRSDIPDRGPSEYEVTGVPVTLETSAELRRNMTYLYPNPSLLMGKVRDNIDPFGRYSDQEIARTLHFLKMIRTLKEYSGFHSCENIEIFLKAKQNLVKLNEVNLLEMKERRIEEAGTPSGNQTELKLPKKSGQLSKFSLGSGVDDLKRIGRNGGMQSPQLGSIIFPLKNSSPLNQPSPLTMTISPMNKSRMMKEMQDRSNMSASMLADKQPNRTPEHLKESEADIRKEPKINKNEDEEEGVEENEAEDLEEEKRLLAAYTLNNLDKELEINLKDKDFRTTYLRKVMKSLSKIFFGKNYNLESKEEEQVREFFEQQFINDFPVPMPIPERAKRLNEDLEDFEMDYENHSIHFEDERNLIYALLDMEVGQNGKNLNDDCRKIIMMAKVYLDKPPILILDEDSLYIKGVNRSFYIKQLFQNLRESGILSFVKDLKQLYHYTSITILKGGKVIEQDPPLDLIDRKNSELYKIVVSDDIRTLRQLENRLDNNLRKFERAKRKEINAVKKRKLNLKNMDHMSHNPDNSVNTPGRGDLISDRAREMSRGSSPRLTQNDNVLKSTRSSKTRQGTRLQTIKQQNFFALSGVSSESEAEREACEVENHNGTLELE